MATRELPKSEWQSYFDNVYLSRLRMPRLECVSFCEGLGAKTQQ
jgi:hypothetical protein